MLRNLDFESPGTARTGASNANGFGFDAGGTSGGAEPDGKERVHHPIPKPDRGALDDATERAGSTVGLNP